MKYARIIKLFAEKGHLTYEDAMDKFYNSDTYTIISEGVADMHCMSDEYLADELLLEFGMMHAPGTSLAFKNKRLPAYTGSLPLIETIL